MSLRAMLMTAGAGSFAILLILLQVAGAQRDQARREARESGVRAAAVARDAETAGEAAKAVERAQARELETVMKAREAADEIADAAGADAPISPDVLRLWGDAIDSLRLDADRASARADPGRPDAPRTMSPAAATAPPERG